MNKKSKRAIIGDEYEEVISRYVLDFPNIKRTDLAEKIQAEVKWSGKPPEIEVLERKISHYRRNLSNPSREDQPWNIGTLGDFPISHEALPTVLAVCKYARDAGNVFTIRRAKWTARLSGVLRDQPLWYSWYWTERYTGAELISHLINRPFDTTTLDAQLNDPEWQQRAADQFKHQITVLERLLEREQSGRKYPPAIWEQEKTQGEQPANQSESKKHKKDKGGTK
jgi:hypothetical protein